MIGELLTCFVRSAEIRNLIWRFACAQPPRVHFLALPDVAEPAPRIDIADDLRLQTAGYRRKKQALLNYYGRQTKKNWCIPDYVRYEAALKFVASLRLVCPESRAVVDRVASLRSNVVGLKGGPRAPASLENDIFCFRSLPKAYFGFLEGTLDWTDTTRLLVMRPHIRPAQIAIEIMLHDTWYCVANFTVNFTVNASGSLLLCLPRGFAKTIEWARIAKEESSLGRQVAVKPPQEPLAVDLQDLHTVFILSYGITVVNPQASGNSDNILPTHFYNTLVEGLESRFYVLDPDAAEVLQHWDIPPYVWNARQKIDQLFNLSASWKVDVKLMAAIGETFSRNHTSILTVPTADFERQIFGDAVR